MTGLIEGPNRELEDDANEVKDDCCDEIWDVKWLVGVFGAPKSDEVVVETVGCAAEDGFATLHKSGKALPMTGVTV